MRKLREYKRVAYNPERGRWLYDYLTYTSATSLIAENPHFTDDDHAELMRLKADPYEPVPRLEDVVYGWLKEEIECRTGGTFPPINHWRLIDRLRAAFPHIDQEGS
jgi:hypothetical protein